jgi:acetyltransferase
MVKNTVMESINTMLRPGSIAVVGASPRLQYGGRFLNNLIETGYKGRLYPVNPKYEEIMGVRCYPDISSLPEAPDLAGIIVPADRTMPILEECGRKGVKTGVVIAGGFAELGTTERKAAQKALSQFSLRTGMRLCGPNCLGIANVTANVWPCSARLAEIQAASTGHLALISQSGASAFGPFLIRAQDRGLGLSHIVSTGNEADLDTSDFIRYCIRQPEVKAIVAYFESIKDVGKFREVVAEALAEGKPIVAIKIGRTSAGQRAARSHTASMTGSDQAYDALFRQTGVIRAEDWDELLDTASLLAKTPPFTRETVGVVAHSGGVASLLADKCSPVLDMPRPSARTREGLENILKGFGSSANPADITWHAFEETTGSAGWCWAPRATRPRHGGLSALRRNSKSRWPCYGPPANAIQAASASSSRAAGCRSSTAPKTWRRHSKRRCFSTRPGNRAALRRQRPPVLWRRP